MEKRVSPLVRARKRSDRKQRDIAVKLDVAQATVSNWESGVTAPHPSRWPAIAEAYGIPLSRLLAFFSEKKTREAKAS